MHIDKVQKGIQSFIFGCDEDDILDGGVQPAFDPDSVPTTIPLMTFSFIPYPYSGIFDAFLMEWIFWFNNPHIAEISDLIDNIEVNSTKWLDINYGSSVIGRMQVNFLKSPSTGGMYNLKFITLYIKMRTIFYGDAC